MEKFIERDIIHWNLATKGLSGNISPYAYTVFWWKNIPLGHLDPAKKPILQSIDDTCGIAWHTIQPTLIAYGMSSYLDSKTNPNTSSITPDKLTALLKTHLDPLIPAEYPNKLPISLVICTHNRPEDIRKCLLRIFQLQSQPSEVIVIDNAPPNDLTEKICKQFPEVIYFQEPKKGLSRARNMGIKVSTQEIIVFTDDDVEVESNWIFRIWETFENDQNAEAMTGLILPLEIRTMAQEIFEKNWSFNKGYTDKKFDNEFFARYSKEGPPVWEIGAGANMAFRKKSFQDVQNFNVDLGPAGASGCGDDSEMWFRVIQNGKKIVYNPRAVVFHKHRETMEGLTSQIEEYMKGHTVAALVQHRINPNLGYKKRVFTILPKYYFKRLKRYWKLSPYQRNILKKEISGWIQGIFLYRKEFKNKSLV